MADQAVLKYLSIDTTFDPCYLSLDSTFKWWNTSLPIFFSDEPPYYLFPLVMNHQLTYFLQWWNTSLPISFSD